MANIMRSDTELLNMEIPRRESIWGELLPTKSKAALAAPTKVGKSFFALELSICITHGLPFLGLPTIQSKVLYLNFEISEEALVERIEDIYSTLGLTENGLLQTISQPENMHLDEVEGVGTLHMEIGLAKSRMGGLDLLVIDPRRQSMAGDENRSDITNIWCENMNSVQSLHNLTSLTIHHTGKGTTGVGRGSSVFDGWLDTYIMLRPQSDVQQIINPVKAEITARDSEGGSWDLEFSYPHWRVADNQQIFNQTAYMQVEQFIINKLQSVDVMSLQELRMSAVQAGYSQSTFHRCLKDLKGKKVQTLSIKGKHGNHHSIALLQESGK